MFLTTLDNFWLGLAMITELCTEDLYHERIWLVVKKNCCELNELLWFCFGFWRLKQYILTYHTGFYPSLIFFSTNYNVVWDNGHKYWIIVVVTIKFCQKVCNRNLLNFRKNQGDPKIFPGAIKILQRGGKHPPGK